MSVDTDPFIVVPLNPLRSEPDAKAVQAEKQRIRTEILGASNEALIQNAWAMEELRSLGSDLNINAFACNFRINGEVNTDVVEANYLNNRIFDILSLTGVGELPETIPMFLSATTFAHEDYGECADAYKR